MIPTGNTDDLVNELVKTVGLDNLAKLDEWKDRNLRESSTPTANAPLDSSHVTYSGAGSYGGMQGTASELSDAGDDTSKLMAGLLRLVGDRVREAMLSRDERTLD
ncbi:hypothetical protein BDV28DRAFT_25990 [Aspergillus coremiiformis]|uniref:Uncharacterized protein n=1 Tax=Aspergillus coremiiformis TaxID=138285 RepID=A0A5N6Z118_9EURO|nr:hypothetical protein BDV28DRAFT_25990 [Aspergillus coremiiformis]